MKPYKDFKSEPSISGESEKIPVGAYVAEIYGAKELKYDWGSKLEVLFDISNGEYAGFFKKQYDADTNPDKKWKGKYTINVPNEKNQWYENQVKSFNNFIFSIEDSNADFKWDWDEKKLKGNLVGIVFREKEILSDDCKSIFIWHEPYTTRTVDDVLDGKVKEPKKKGLSERDLKLYNEHTAPVDTAATFDDDELPF